MIRDITIGQYYPADSVLHRLDPRTKLAGTLIFIVSVFLFHTLPGYAVATVFLAAVILGNTGLQFFQMLVWAMVTDCIDVQEARTGRRSDGSVYSLYTLSRKLGSALAASSISYILGVMGMV